jgi:hypothetical protein
MSRYAHIAEQYDKPYRNARVSTPIWMELGEYAYNANKSLARCLEDAILEYLDRNDHQYRHPELEGVEA